MAGPCPLSPPETVPEDDETHPTMDESPSKLGGRRVFDDSTKHAEWGVSIEFPETPTLLPCTHNALVPKGKVALVAIEAVSADAKFAASMRNVIRPIHGPIKFYRGNRSDTKIELAGEQSLALLHDYLESPSERGRTAPPAAKPARPAWTDAIGNNWQLTGNLLCSAAVVETNECPTQAPATKLATLRAIEGISTNPLNKPSERAFAPGVLLMTYTSLRFSDVRRLRSFEVNDDASHGALSCSETKRKHGQFCPIAFPRVGVSGSSRRVRPRLDVRDAFLRQGGSRITFNFTSVDHTWEPAVADAAPYATARRKPTLMCVALGDAEGGPTRYAHLRICAPPRKLRGSPTNANSISSGVGRATREWMNVTSVSYAPTNYASLTL